MAITQKTLTVQTRGRSTYDITNQVTQVVSEARQTIGLVHVFTHHSSCSLMLCENADPDVRRDLETFMSALAKDGDPRFIHQDEGPDDMPAHIRSVLTGMDLTIPIIDGNVGLGTWQGVYLWEHRTAPHRRKVTVTVISG